MNDLKVVSGEMTMTELLARSGKNIRKYRLRTAINEDRARKEIALAREEGLHDGEIRQALGFSVDEWRQLLGIA